MIANSVVLPAPFGPTSATIWPSSAVKAARSSASSPPKRRDTFSTRRISAIAAPRQPETTVALEHAHDAAWRVGDDQNEHGTINNEIESGRIADKMFGGLTERLHHQGAEQRAVEGAETADDRRE